MKGTVIQSLLDSPGDEDRRSKEGPNKAAVEGE